MKFLDIEGVKTLWSKIIPVNKIELNITAIDETSQSVVKILEDFFNNNLNPDNNGFDTNRLNYIIVKTKDSNNNSIVVGYILFAAHHVYHNTTEIYGYGLGFITNFVYDGIDSITGTGVYLYSIDVDGSISDGTTIKNIVL